MDRKQLLDEVEKIVCTDREQQYGTPENNFGCIAALWSIYLEHPVTPKDVAIMMTLLKIARIKTGLQKRDSWIDAIGYLVCGGALNGTENN